MVVSAGLECFEVLRGGHLFVRGVEGRGDHAVLSVVLEAAHGWLISKLLPKICKLGLYNLKCKTRKEDFLVGVSSFQGKRAGLVRLSFKRGLHFLVLIAVHIIQSLVRGGDYLELLTLIFMGAGVLTVANAMVFWRAGIWV